MTNPESCDRRRAMLRTAMGPAIAVALADPLVIEVMVNPDGALRLDRLGEGRVDTGVRLAPAEVERIIRLVASHVRAEIHPGNPVVSAELPARDDGASGERFEGLLPYAVHLAMTQGRKLVAKIHPRPKNSLAATSRH
jgi:Flp pilus assembly CpaF family ATPase